MATQTTQQIRTVNVYHSNRLIGTAAIDWAAYQSHCKHYGKNAPIAAGNILFTADLERLGLRTDQMVCCKR